MASKEGMRRVHIFISGLVQGVGFRYFVYSRARGLGIKGWVRNLSDGRVEIVGEGDAEAIKDFIKEVSRGPVMAKVSKVEVIEEKFTGEFKDFRVTY
ncbi:MAG: acylphosphatase [Candidatus Asgardarchaeia archaeon]